MTTSTAHPTSPRCLPHQSTCDTSSFHSKESPEVNSSTRGCDDDSFHSSNILRRLPTSTQQKPEAITAVDTILDDDDGVQPLLATTQEDKTPNRTFLQEWEDFYVEFKNSITYTLACSSPTPHLVDDGDDDRTMSDGDDDRKLTNNSDGLRQLRRAVKRLEQVNLQFAQMLESLELAYCQPIQRIEHEILLFDDPTPKTAPCAFPPPPPPDPTPLPTWVTPDAPMPASSPEPPRDDVPRAVQTPPPPPAPNLPPSLIQNPTQQSSTPNNRHRTIPTWAQPAVTTHALAGMPCMSQKPPPRPARKPLPFKKKTPTKPHAANQKDFLRPP